MTLKCSNSRFLWEVHRAGTRNLPCCRDPGWIQAIPTPWPDPQGAVPAGAGSGLSTAAARGAGRGLRTPGAAGGEGASLAFPIPTLPGVPMAAHSCSQRFPVFPVFPTSTGHSHPQHSHRSPSFRLTPAPSIPTVPAIPGVPQLLDGRRRTGGRLEVWVRIREPLGAQRQLEPRSERWLVLEPGAEATVSARNPPGSPGIGRRRNQPGINNPELLLLRSPFPNRPWQPQRTGTTGEGWGGLGIPQGIPGGGYHYGGRIGVGIEGGKLWDPPGPPIPLPQCPRAELGF